MAMRCTQINNNVSRRNAVVARAAPRPEQKIASVGLAAAAAALIAAAPAPSFAANEAQRAIDNRPGQDLPLPDPIRDFGKIFQGQPSTDSVKEPIAAARDKVQNPAGSTLGDLGANLPRVGGAEDLKNKAKDAVSDRPGQDLPLPDPIRDFGKIFQGQPSTDSTKEPIAAARDKVQNPAGSTLGDLGANLPRVGGAEDLKNKAKDAVSDRPGQDLPLPDPIRDFGKIFQGQPSTDSTKEPIAAARDKVQNPAGSSLGDLGANLPNFGGPSDIKGKAQDALDKRPGQDLPVPDPIRDFGKVFSGEPSTDAKKEPFAAARDILGRPINKPNVGDLGSSLPDLPNPADALKGNKDVLGGAKDAASSARSAVDSAANKAQGTGFDLGSTIDAMKDSANRGMESTKRVVQDGESPSSGLKGALGFDRKIGQ